MAATTTPSSRIAEEVTSWPGVEAGPRAARQIEDETDVDDVIELGSTTRRRADERRPSRSMI
ncbi:MAG: hypothetical protein JJE35_04990 [Thermoleophilia bacterium]|nr:hypothetical protein [Thermoleophilia bacterium]